MLDTEAWESFSQDRLVRWLQIFEETGRRSGLEAERGYLLGTAEATVVIPWIPDGPHGYVSLLERTARDLEPPSDTWELLLTQYSELLEGDFPYQVTGILTPSQRVTVYDYKGDLNSELDDNWSGFILDNHTQLTDRCDSRRGTKPDASSAGYVGLSFDKHSPGQYTSNCDTTWNGYSDCRWENCNLPSSISSSDNHVQMTMHIFVR